jgi:hypothetical protein
MYPSVPITHVQNATPRTLILRDRNVPCTNPIPKAHLKIKFRKNAKKGRSSSQFINLDKESQESLFPDTSEENARKNLDTKVVLLTAHAWQQATTSTHPGNRSSPSS